MSSNLVANKTFSHGIHPPENKQHTCNEEIKQFPFAPVMVILLSQHIGAPAKAIVREEQEVTRGQKIAEAVGFMSVPMHAPASGVIKKIGLAPGPGGKMVPAIYLQPFPGSGQSVDEGKPCHLETATPEEIINAVQDAGIVGLGGAAFPTHVKLKIPEGKSIDTIILNGVECEPYLTADHRVMLEQVDDIILGTRYLMKATGAERTIIGIEANKPDAAEALLEKTKDSPEITVELVKIKYPQGAEKMLIKALLDREVPSGGLPIETGVIVNNVATTAEIGRLLPHGRGIQERVVTITGEGIARKGNYLIPIGTPLRYALEQVGMDESVTSVVLGGPMMGQAVTSLDIPIMKGTSGIVCFSQNGGTEFAPDECACIRCGRCLEACPIFLNPSRLGLLAKAGAYDEMISEYHLFDCFECGSCSYICPSRIPLVQHFRVAKRLMREKQQKKSA